MQLPSSRSFVRQAWDVALVRLLAWSMPEHVETYVNLQHVTEGVTPGASRSVSNPAVPFDISRSNREEVRRNVSKGRVDEVDVPPRI